MPHSYNTRLQARFQREAEEQRQREQRQREAEERRRRERSNPEYVSLGEEIISRGGANYLGNGSIGGDDIDWRQWVLNSMKRGRCPYR